MIYLLSLNLWSPASSYVKKQKVCKQIPEEYSERETVEYIMCSFACVE